MKSAVNPHGGRFRLGVRRVGMGLPAQRKRGPGRLGRGCLPWCARAGLGFFLFPNGGGWGITQPSYQAAVAQLDRALPSEGRGRGFEFLRLHQYFQRLSVCSVDASLKLVATE